MLSHACGFDNSMLHNTLITADHVGAVIVSTAVHRYPTTAAHKIRAGSSVTREHMCTFYFQREY
jgi:hypothetical protein